MPSVRNCALRGALPGPPPLDLRELCRSEQRSRSEIQGACKSGERGHAEVQRSPLDALELPDRHVGLLRELFLGPPTSGPGAPNVRRDAGKDLGVGGFRRHPPQVARGTPLKNDGLVVLS
jgi:hypothetical protein